MGAPEGIVNVQLGQIGKLFGEVLIVLGLLRVEPSVLQHEKVTGTQPRHRGLGHWPHTIRSKLDCHSKQLGELRCDRA